MTKTETAKKKVAIIGAGIGGVFIATELRFMTVADQVTRSSTDLANRSVARQQRINIGLASAA